MFVIFEVLHNLDFKHDTIPGGLFFSVTISFILPSSSPTQSRGKINMVDSLFLFCFFKGLLL